MPSGILGIFLPPQVAQRIALPEGEAINDLHITLVPLEDVEDTEALKHTVAQWAQHQVPFTARISGVGRFNASRDDEREPFYASIDSVQLTRFREALISTLRWEDEADVKISKQHGFTPHITLAYLAPDEPSPISTLPSVEFEIDTLSLAIGDERHELKLEGGFERVKATKGREDAPNYHISRGNIKCSNCRFGNNDDRLCSEYRFNYDVGYVCDSWGAVAGDDDEAAKAGRRNNREDQETIQGIHDMTKGLGAKCGEDRDKEGMKNDDPDHDEPAYKAALAPSNALKAISQTDDAIIVGNYIALWGGRDLEGQLSNNVNPDGTKGEYFTKNTTFGSDYTDVDAVVVDFEHGRKPDREGPGRDEPLGRVLWNTATKDGTGLWVQRALNRRNRYIQMLEQLGVFEKGWIGTSSEAVSSAVQKGDNGEIRVWPIRRDTLTFTPMEPRMIEGNQLSTLKALANDIPQVAEICQAKGICLDAESEDAGASDEVKKAMAQAEANLLLVELEANNV